MLFKEGRMRSKKAQGLSINVIIIAVIALIVLVILIVIFTGRMSIFGKNLDDATTLKSGCSGEWRISCNEGEQPNYAILPDGENVGKSCCIPESG